MTISEYILEQSISTATCRDIEIERSLAEMNVLAEMCRCYDKAETFAEYASDPSVVVECGIFLEADGSTENGEEKKKGTFKKFMESVGGLLSKAWAKFIEIIEKLFTDSTIKALNKIPEDTIIVPKDSQMYGVAIHAFAYSVRIDRLIHDFVEAIRDNDDDFIKLLADKNGFDKQIRGYIDEDTGRVEYYKQTVNFTKEMMMDELEKLKKQKTFKKSKELMRDVKDTMDKNSYDGDVNDIKHAVKNITEHIARTTKYITYVYDECIKLSYKKK